MALTYGTVRIEDGYWVLDNLPPHACMRFKDVFPRTGRTARLPFKVKVSPASSADLEWFMARYPLEIAANDQAEMVAGRETQQRAFEAAAAILAPGWEPPPLIGFREGQALRPYQAQAVQLCMARRGLLLGDDLGLGKTFVGCGLMVQPGTRPCAVVTPVHLQSQWLKVVRAVTTLRVHVVKKMRPYDLPPADVYLFRYSQLRGWFDLFGSGFFRSVIFEEAHELRTGLASDKGRAAKQLAENAGWRLGLTATPVQGYGTEIHPVMSFINDEVLGPFEEFHREWLPLDDEKARGLGSYLRDQGVYLRRTKADVGQQLPPVNRIVETIDWDAKTLERVEDLARQLAIKAVNGSFMERGQAARDLDLMVRRATGVAKARAVALFVRLLCDAGRKVLLAGWHRDVYDIWLKELAALKPAMYTGSESPKQKADAIDAFVSGEAQVLIISLRAGAGIDGLQHVCSTVVAGELDWQPGVHNQLIGRLDREGQTEPVDAFFLIAQDGSDPPMVEVLGIKSSQAAAITDPLGQAVATPADESRMRALVQRYLRPGDIPTEAEV